MTWTPHQILSVLDQCCDTFTFPMLDNGYVYLSAARLTAFRSATDWALVFEIFGFSPREGTPSLAVTTFGSSLINRPTKSDYVSDEAYLRYLANHPHDQSKYFYPFDDDAWQNADDPEYVVPDVGHVLVRGTTLTLPPPSQWFRNGVTPSNPSQLQTFEFCRVVAELARERVLATPDERRASVPTDLTQILVLDDWRHPDIADAACKPSTIESFQQLAQVLATGDVTAYRPSAPGNTHWSNWPDGGSL